MAGKMQRQELPETGKECSAAASMRRSSSKK
jgi:hypothetical protein